jgi:hypothetical protein
MPELCRFYGIVVKMFYDDHNPPHFHAEYGEHEMRTAGSPSLAAAAHRDR